MPLVSSDDGGGCFYIHEEAGLRRSVVSEPINELRYAVMATVARSG